MVCSRESVSGEERAPLCTPNVPKYSKILCPWSKLGLTGDAQPRVDLERFWVRRGGRKKQTCRTLCQ